MTTAAAAGAGGAQQKPRAMIQSHGTGVLLGDYFKSDSQTEFHHEPKGKF